jgi:hypothetical protein
MKNILYIGTLAVYEPGERRGTQNDFRVVYYFFI